MILTEVAVAEAVWVLHSFYNIKRNPIAEWFEQGHPECRCPLHEA